MMSWQQVSRQNVSTLKTLQVLQPARGGTPFQARCFSSMQSLRSTLYHAKSPSRQTTHIFTTRISPIMQRLGQHPFPLACSTILIRRASWLPSRRSNINVQQVKFLPPPNRFRYLPIRWIQSILIFLLVMRIAGIILGRRKEDIQLTTIEIQDQTTTADEQSSAQAEDKEEGEGEEDEEITIDIDPESAWFLPLTWPRRKPSIPYKASDEEWQEFCKLSQDRDKQLVVKNQAVDYVHYIANHHPAVSKMLGTTSPRSRYWLDIDYPIRYDEGYETTGIVVTDEFIALASRDYDDSTIEHFRRVVSTLPIISALWNVSKAIFTGEEAITTIMKKNDKLPIAIPGVPDLSATPELAKVLRSSIRQLQTRPRSLKSVPRGCVLVSGRVDVQGTKAWAQFSILGYYNPQHEAWAALPLIGLGPVRPIKLKPVG